MPDARVSCAAHASIPRKVLATKGLAVFPRNTRNAMILTWELSRSNFYVADTCFKDSKTRTSKDNREIEYASVWLARREFWLGYARISIDRVVSIRICWSLTVLRKLSLLTLAWVTIDRDLDSQTTLDRDRVNVSNERRGKIERRGSSPARNWASFWITGKRVYHQRNRDEQQEREKEEKWQAKIKLYEHGRRLHIPCEVWRLMPMFYLC